MSIYYINGHFVEADAAQVSARDLSVLRGYGAFDFLRTYGGHPFRLDKNIARLRNSCNLIELDLQWSDDEIREIVMQTLERNAGVSDEFSIRLVVTGGISSDNITPMGEPSLLVLVAPLSPLPEAWYTEGAKVATIQMQREIPGAKSTNYISAIIAQKRARAVGGIEALYVSEAGIVTEGTTTNLFAFYGNTLVTPAEGILYGITRRTVLELAEPHYAIEKREMTLDELLKADEVFITAANKQVVPIIQIDDTAISPAPGEHTRYIMERFAELTQKRATGELV